MLPQLTQNQIEQIARILGDTENGFSGSELGRLFAQTQISDHNQGATKWIRLYDNLHEEISRRGSTDIVFKLIRCCMEPASGLKDCGRYVWMRAELNKVLMLVGIEIKDNGQLNEVSKATSIDEVRLRTKELCNKLSFYRVHPNVLKCCTEEALAKDYFHAVHEAAKSLCDRVRELSGLDKDGAELIQIAFSIRDPYVAYTRLDTESGRNQQNGLKEMLCGVIHMVRNVTAHELRIRWDIKENDAIDILIQISYLHKLLDNCVRVPRTITTKI